MLTTILLLGGTLGFVVLGFAIFHARGCRRGLLALAAVALLVALSWTGMALIEPGSV